jgi:hypothetical protein
MMFYSGKSRCVADHCTVSICRDEIIFCSKFDYSNVLRPRSEPRFILGLLKSSDFREPRERSLPSAPLKIDEQPVSGSVLEILDLHLNLVHLHLYLTDTS